MDLYVAMMHVPQDAANMAMNLTISTLLSIISFLVCCTSAKEGADSDTSVSLQCPSGMGSEGVLWDVRFSSHVHIQLQGLDVDAVGNTYLGVVLDPRFSSDTGPVTFGSFEVVPGDAADIILIKMSPEGEVLWVRQLGGDGPQVVWALSACGDGLVLEGEAPPGTLVLGGEIVTASVFIASFDGAGQHSWTRPVSVLDADGFVYAQDMACNATGHLVLTGKLKGRVNFGGETVIPLHNEDGYLARFDPKGELLWASTFGDPASSGQTVAYTKNDDIVVAGSYRDSADFGGGGAVCAGARCRISGPPHSGRGASMEQGVWSVGDGNSGGCRQRRSVRYRWKLSRCDYTRHQQLRQYNSCG